MKLLVNLTDGDPHVEWDGDMMWICLFEGANPPEPEDGLEWADFQGYTVKQIL